MTTGTTDPVLPVAMLVWDWEALNGKGTDWVTERDREERISTRAVWLNDGVGSEGFEGTVPAGNTENM